MGLFDILAVLDVCGQVKHRKNLSTKLRTSVTYTYNLRKRLITETMYD